MAGVTVPQSRRPVPARPADLRRLDRSASHVLADRLSDRSAWLRALNAHTEFDNATARADEGKRAGYDRRPLPYRSRDFH